MASFTYTIPDDKLHRIIDAENGMRPMSDEDKAIFTKAQWAKESLRRLIVDRVFRWENEVAKEAVIKIPKDNSIIT